MSSHVSSEDKKQGPTWLSRHGGWILLLASVVLLGLAAIFSNRPAVAPIFALGGIALAILGVLLSRVHGAFEFNATGFKFFLAEVERESRELPPAVKAQVLDLLLELASERRVSRQVDPVRDARRIVNSALNHQRLHEDVKRWLEAQGWQVNTKVPPPREGRPADVIAEKGGEVLVIEVYGGGRAIRNWGDVRYVLNRVREGWEGDQSARIAVFLGQTPPQRSLTRITDEGFEVWVHKGDNFERLG